MLSISEVLREATEVLRSSGVAEARREAGSLLAFVLKKDKTFLIAHSDYLLSATEKSEFESVINRRANREPFQYIVGKQEFYGLDFFVTKGVLIPRPETELIVENALEILKPRENPRFCEIGTGSGCISVAILHENKMATAIAVDISKEALATAKTNAEKNRVSDRLELKISDVFSQIKPEKFDLIVSNPPYVPSEDFETLQREVRDFEPQIALTDGKNGLSIIEKIITDAPKYLLSEGFLLMEVGFNQSRDARDFFSDKIWKTVEFFSDLQGIPRMLKAKIK